MLLRMAGRSLLVALALACLVGCAATVEVRPAAEAVAPTVAAIVGLPLSIGWGGTPSCGGSSAAPATA